MPLLRGLAKCLGMHHLHFQRSKVGFLAARGSLVMHATATWFHLFFRSLVVADLIVALPDLFLVSSSLDCPHELEGLFLALRTRGHERPRDGIRDFGEVFLALQSLQYLFHQLAQLVDLLADVGERVKRGHGLARDLEQELGGRALERDGKGIILAHYFFTTCSFIRTFMFPGNPGHWVGSGGHFIENGTVWNGLQQIPRSSKN